MPPRPSRLIVPVLLASLACGPSVVPTGSDGDGSGGSETTGETTGSPTGGTGPLPTDTGSSTLAADETASSSGEALDAWCLVAQPTGVPDTVDVDPFVNADVDGNGLPELWAFDNGGPTGQWYAITQAPDGSFVATLREEEAEGANLWKILDVDGDGRDDAVFRGDWADPSDGYWRAGMPDGSFSDAQQPVPDDQGEWGEIDGDEIADRLSWLGDFQYVVELGIGDGSFQPELGVIELGWEPRLLPMAAIPGDFAVYSDDGGIGFPSYYVRTYRFDPMRGPMLMGEAAYGNPNPWAVLDIEGDGYTDLVIDEPTIAEPGLYLARGQADQTFAHEVLDEGAAARHGAVGDFDGDGLADVLWLRNADAQLWLRRGAPGGFEAAVLVEGAELLENELAGDVTTVWPADYDGDGRVSWVTRDADVLQANELVPCAG